MTDTAIYNIYRMSSLGLPLDQQALEEHDPVREVLRALDGRHLSHGAAATGAGGRAAADVHLLPGRQGAFEAKGKTSDDIYGIILYIYTVM